MIRRGWLIGAGVFLTAVPVIGQVRLADATEESGVLFRHESGGCGHGYLVEQIGGGVILDDLDADGALDLVLISGRSIGDCPDTGANWTRYFKGDGKGRFVDVTVQAGFLEVGYGVGGATGDIDGDGDLDLYITCYGPNRLYINDGGRFRDVAGVAGVNDAAFSTGCAFLDFDGDGHLDLYVSNYVLWDTARHDERRQTEDDAAREPGPEDYRAAPDRLYRGDGRGRFRDVTLESGVLAPRSRSLGVAVGDYDADGRPDIFVAASGTGNLLFHNLGGGRFEEVALVAGVAVGAGGELQRAAGAAWGDLDGDGRLDLVVTNHDGEPHTIAQNRGRGLFSDGSWASLTGQATFPLVGWAAIPGDFDLDGHLDLFFAHGAASAEIEEVREARSTVQSNFLFRGVGDGRFARVSAAAAPALALRECSRGAAAGDIDSDGDLDVVVSNRGERAQVLRNDTPRTGHWLGVRCRRRAPGRSSLGTRITLRAGDRTQVRELGSGGYLSQNDRRALFGIGTATRVDWLEVRWPGGATERFEVREIDRYFEIVEGTGTSRTQSSPK